MKAQPERTHLETDVLIIGAGAAGMSAAIAAHDAGADIMLVDRSLIGRGGATVMAQMTVAAALGDEVPDDWHYHLADTLKAGRALCDEPLAAILCEGAPAAIRQMDDWHAGWARHPDGRIDVPATTQLITSVVERWVRENPDQWLWFHRRWR